MRNSTVPLLVDTKHMQMTDMQFPWFAAQTRLVSSMAAGVPGTGTPLPGGLSDGFAFRGPSFGADDGMNSDDFIPGLGAAEHFGNPPPPAGPRQGGGGRNEDWGSGGGGGGGSGGGGGGGGGRRGGGGGYYERQGGLRRGRH